MIVLALGFIFLVSICGFFYGINRFIKRKTDEGFASSFISIGVTLITASFGTFYTKLKEMTIILINSRNVDDSLKVSREISKTNYVQLVVGFILIIIGLYFVYYIKHRLYILNINGYISNRIEDHYKRLKLSQFEFKEREVDFIKEERNEMTAYRSKDIMDLITRKINSFREESRSSKKGYTGIAQIPFIAFAGTFLKRTEIDKYYEFDKKETETFYKLDERKNFLELKDQTDYDNLNNRAEEVVLSVSTTTSITDAQLKQFEDCEIIRLSVEDQKDNTIRSKNQLFNYRNKIIEVIGKLPRIFENIKRVHLVCSTQSCLVLEIGKSIEDHRNVQIITYHFVAGADKKYPWGIVINGTEKGKFIKG